MKFKPGDTVRVIGSRGTAKIGAILTSMHGALLEKQIGGFRQYCDIGLNNWCSYLTTPADVTVGRTKQVIVSV
jgi:hypothetical protein